MENDTAPKPMTIKEAKAYLEELGYRFMERTSEERLLFTIIGFLSFAAWIALFVSGCWIDTSSSRFWMLNNGFDSCDLFRVMLFWTPTNVAWLGLFSALAAGCLSYNTDPRTLRSNMVRALIMGDGTTLDRLQRQMEYVYEVPWVSMKRSFAVYLLVIASSYLLDTSPFSAPAHPTAEDIANAQEKYVHLAAIVSALSFVVGFDPTRFQGFVERIAGWSIATRFDAQPTTPGGGGGGGNTPLPKPALPAPPGPLTAAPAPPKKDSMAPPVITGYAAFAPPTE